MGISALYVLALAYPVHRHVVGIFSDFYRWYAPDADRIAAGLFPRNTYNPPGYPLLLALASPLTGDHFSSGKWISLVAAGLVGVLAFHLHRRLFGAAPALLAVPIILSSHAFTAYAISAMTDVPFVCLCLGAMLVITGDQGGGWRSAALGGVLCGVAYVFRYNGAFLLAPALLGMIWRDGKWISRAEVAAVFLGSFALAAAPWWALNYAHHGSAFYSTNYEDVAKAVGVHGNFTSLVDVVLHDPGQFAWNYAKGVGPMLVRSFGASLALFPVGPLAAIGIALSLVKHRRRPVILVLVGALAFLLFMSLTHWERRYFLFLLACYSGFAAFAIFEIARLVGHVAGSPRAARVVIVAFALAILIPSIGRVWRTVGTILERQPTELLPAARYLASVAPPGATVMAVRAQIAYLSGREWQETPDAKSVEELKSMLRKQPADYLVYDRWGRFRKPLAALATPDASFSWLHPIYRDPSVVIYAVQLDRR
jgi:4-amino-4-deoxy-L-arabinose transferase-like glycosyltransferase